MHGRVGGNLHKSKQKRRKRIPNPSAAPDLKRESSVATAKVNHVNDEMASFDTDRPTTVVKRAAMALLAAIFIWSYWPTLVELVKVWYRQPDYSHGFLVIPFSIFFLWYQRDSFPGVRRHIAWAGLTLVGLSIAVRLFASQFYLSALDALSMVIWVGGVVWLLFGWRAFRWSLPSIAFLVFMIPLPFRVAHGLSYPLQRVATKLSCATLQCLGQPAIAEGNTILVNDSPFQVEEACSGLRIFMGVVALASAYLILIRRAWWEKVLLLLAVVPIALGVNAIRIVATVLLDQYATSEFLKKLIHDGSGLFIEIPLAAALFGLVLWYLGKLIRPVQHMSVGAVIRHEA